MYSRQKSLAKLGDGPPSKRAPDDYRPKPHGFICRAVNLLTYLCTSSKVSKRSKRLSKNRQLPPIDFRRAIGHKLRKIEVIKMALGHTHPTAAALRTSASLALEKVVKECGFQPYHVSMANRDRADGCRYYYFAKDLDKPFRDDPVTKNNVLIMIDVDYYLDVNHWLQYGNPLLMYTFAPTTAGGELPDGSFTISDDTVTYNVSGGATYKHQVWDYRGDTVSVIDKYGNLLVYDIEQHVLSADPTRRIVCFFPKATVKYPYYGFMGPAEPLQRRKYNFEGLPAGDEDGRSKTMVTMVRDECRKTISVAAAGSPVSVTIREDLYTAIAIRHRVAKKPTIADVERHLSAEKVEQAPIRAAILYRLLVDERLLGTPATTALACVPRMYQSVGPLVNEDGKDVGRAVAPSLVTQPAVFPVKSYNNDVASVLGRVVKMKNTAIPPNQYLVLAAEFLNLIVPESKIGTGCPLSIADVIEIQDRPAQRNRSAIVTATASANLSNKVKAMLKAEPYGGTNDPRNISTVDTNHTLHLSGFTYAFKRDCLKDLKWYSPGKTPEEQCDRLQKICRDGTILRDYDRYDGTISEWLQTEIVQAMYVRWCNIKYRPELLVHLKNEDPATGTTAHGYKYKPGFSRKSGSPLTTDGNTVINAYNAYCAYRLCGQMPEVAWKSLGLYCGDDGVDRIVPGLAEHFVVVSEALGLKIKLETTAPGEPLVYCGRVFCDPATTRDSFQDPFRTLAKLHLTAAPPSVDDRTALANRAAGYLVTDSKTPIIGAWCAKVRELAGEGDASKMTGDERWKYQSGAWPQDDPELIREYFCRVVEMDSSEVRSIERAIAAATSVEELPESILDNGHMVKHKLLAVLGHDIVGPKPDVIETEAPTCPSAPTTPETSQSLESAGNKSSPAISSSPSSPPSSGERTLSRPARLPAKGPTQSKSNAASKPSSRTSALAKGARRHKDTNPPPIEVNVVIAPPGPENPPAVIASPEPENQPPVQANDDKPSTSKANRNKKTRARAAARKAKAKEAKEEPVATSQDVAGGH
jgi:hypothetical protein